MTMITCSECGRQVSDKAAACIGCGAPLTSRSGIRLAPAASPASPPTRAQIRWRLAAASLMLLVGVIVAARSTQMGRLAHVVAIAATFLILIGLAWLLITLVQRLSPRD